MNDYNFNFNYDGVSTGVSIDSFSFTGSDGTLNILSKSNGELNGSFSMQNTISSANFTLYTSNSNFPNSKIIIEGNAALPLCMGNVLGQRSREDIRYNLSLAPNPTDTNTTIFYSYHKECKACFIRIFDYNGKEVIQKLACDPSNKKLLNTSNLSEGVYLVVLEEEGIFKIAECMVISR